MAPMLHAALSRVAAIAAAGGDGDAAAAAAGRQLVDDGFAKVDYIAVCDAETLAPAAPGRPARVLAAAWLGRTRLIDNVAVARADPKS